MHNPTNWIEADWSAPKGIRAGTTLRQGGISQAPYDSFNLALHVSDDCDAVETNRNTLFKTLALPSNPVWLNQQHSTEVINADKSYNHAIADASYTRNVNVVCAVLTADCLPIVLCDESGQQVAAIHAGWRGLLNGIIEKTITTFGDRQVIAWLGPAISQQAFEVGDEVRSCFIDHSSQAKQAFVSNETGKWNADIYQLAALRLKAANISDIFGGGHCTFNQQDRFYSYRRNAQTGRMATLIWKL